MYLWPFIAESCNKSQNTTMMIRHACIVLFAGQAFKPLEQYPDFHVHIKSKTDKLHKKCYADHLGLLIKLDHAFNDLHMECHQGHYILYNN